MVPSEQVPTPSLHQLPDPGGPLKRTSIIGARPPGPSVGAFLKIIWHGNRLSRGLQGTSARAMASICVHRAPRTPPDIATRHIGSRDDLQKVGQPATHSRQCPIPRFPAIHLTKQSTFYGPPGHICSRDDLQEEPQPATHSRQCPIPRFPAIHLARQSPFYGPPGHIGSRDGIDLCPSSAANPSRQRSGAHQLAR